MLSDEDVAGLPIEEYAFPGPLRDALVGAILAGKKISTTSLVIEYQLEGAALPEVGQRGAVIDSLGRAVCITEVVDVRVVPLAAVDLAHAVDEGEGYESVAEWRSGHEDFWHSAEFRAEMPDPHFAVSDSTEAILVRFTVIKAA
ncbi:RNA-binding protein [Arthrobacter sp. ERGS1:01]|uniref:ASCH domain-containing protein n=1 Tax=Arthrobacter sp. ERGS1:01 TaxID=1704044 RepID=UPI0006B500D4|nr:ASCH domain-containing protein [Arthrobacter sp. ERGS1:01]ALE06357.1 RNA-binding protein [Arthrobacter sp. ERGS1:01]